MMATTASMENGVTRQKDKATADAAYSFSPRTEATTATATANNSSIMASYNRNAVAEKSCFRVVPCAASCIARMMTAIVSVAGILRVMRMNK